MDKHFTAMIADRMLALERRIEESREDAHHLCDLLAFADQPDLPLPPAAPTHDPRARHHQTGDPAENKGSRS